MTASGVLEVQLVAQAKNSLANNGAAMSFVLSGANTQAAADNYSISYTAEAAGASQYIAGSFLLTGLTPGVTTVKAKYRVSGTTGTFQDRRVTAIPH